MRSVARIAIALVPLLDVACHRSIEPTGSVGTGTGGQVESDGDSSGMPPGHPDDGNDCILRVVECMPGTTGCEDGKFEVHGTMCAGNCTDLEEDAQHCGGCYHACDNGTHSTECIANECQGVGIPCIAPEDEVVSCAEACAREGAVCREGGGRCSDIWRPVLLLPGYEIEGDVCDEDSEVTIAESNSLETHCEDSFQFDLHVWQVAVACCCSLF